MNKLKKLMNALLTGSASGFSLVELLVVVAIVGILAAIGTVGYNQYITTAQNNATITNALAIQKGLQTCDAAANCVAFTVVLAVNVKPPSVIVCPATKPLLLNVTLAVSSDPLTP